MKKDSFYAKRVYPLVFMLLVTVVCISITAGLFLSTQAQVERNASLFLKKTILEAVGVDYPSDFNAISDLFDARVTELEEYYTVVNDEGEQSFVVPFSGPGLWGSLDLMIGFNDDLNAFTGIGIVNQNETPGLGARIEEEWFKTQFAGKWGPFVLVEEGTGSKPNELDAITGATRTTRGIQNIMNRATEEGPEIIREED